MHASLSAWFSPLHLASFLVALLSLCVGQSAVAEESCGDIITPADFVFSGSAESRIPIVDCSNPFDKAQSLTNFTINGETVVDGGTYVVGSEGTLDYGIMSGTEIDQDAYEQYYQHDSLDYRRFDGSFGDIPDAEVQRVINEYFAPDDISAQYYTQIYFADDVWQYFYDFSLNQYIYDARQGALVQAVFNELSVYIATNAVPTRNRLVPGTYTVVIDPDVFGIPLMTLHKRWLSNLAQHIIPTAYATGRNQVVTFTAVAEAIPPTPAGASSVLFLPGIQASRLYTDGLFGSENRIWEPNINADVKKLAMNELGQSINEIYTRDILEEIFGVGNVYKGLVDDLDELVADNIIAEYTDFAYDWRYNVNDIVLSGTRYETEIKSLINEVEELANRSFTGKVTIIGHSNGGLLGKALITELNRLGNADLVDKLVLVGVPQLGTPKAIGVMLHGLDQQAGLGAIINDTTAREVIKNMPSTYALLPSQRYFEVSGGPVVTTDGSSPTDYISAYGDIRSFSQLADFLLDTKDLRKDTNDIKEPIILNTRLLNDAIVLKNVLDDWIAPAEIDVFEIAGTGLATVKGFEYRTFPCSANAVICAFGSYTKPYPLFTNEGDQTVVTLSATDYQGDKFIGVVDLLKEGKQRTVKTKIHSNMTESPTIKAFIDSIIKFPYVNETLEIPPDFIEVTNMYTIIGVHSPVSIVLEDSVGNIVGQYEGEVREDIIGSEYFELADSKYIIVPTDAEYEVTISGEADGLYSLTIDTLSSNNVQENVHTLLGATSTESMVATFTKDVDGFSNLLVDSNGDGEVDIELSLNGAVVAEEVVYTYQGLQELITTLSTHKFYRNALIKTVKYAEGMQTRAEATSSSSKKNRYLSKEKVALDILIGQLRLFEYWRKITADERTLIDNYINNFKK